MRRNDRTIKEIHGAQTKDNASCRIKGRIITLSAAHLSEAYFKSLGVLSNIYFGSDSTITLLGRGHSGAGDMKTSGAAMYISHLSS